MRATPHDLPSGKTPEIPSSHCCDSRFVILGSVALAHVGDVASDYDIVFQGEKGPRIEKISAICDKERLDEVLAKARAREERQANADRPQAAAEGDGPAMHPTPDDPGHKEPWVEAPVGIPGSSATGDANPPVGRVMRGRPLTRLHPFEQRMEAHGVSAGIPARDPASDTVDAPTRRGRRGCPTIQVSL
ncbi:hypothetical protein ZWY2020_001982 [Hordeum vulgare]|nr:hypothetical protein ZWY2020_001982 [Hordeum vulgare]